MKSLGVAALVLLGAASFGQVIEGRLNLRISCPNGATSCWPQVSESIQFSGFLVRGKLDVPTMTVSIQPKPGAQDLRTLIREVKALGDYYDVRAIEIVAVGKLDRTGGITRIVLPNGEAYRLTEPRFRLEQGLNEPHGQPLHKEDRGALSVLARVKGGTTVRLTGIWRPPYDRESRVLEVLRASAP